MGLVNIHNEEGSGTITAAFFVSESYVEFSMWRRIWIHDQIYEDVIPFTIGNNNLNTGRLNLTGCSVFRMHTSTAEGTLLGLYILRKVCSGAT